MSTDNTIDATISATASKATQIGASASIVSWILSSEFGILVGMVIGIGGFLINWYYKAKEDKRRQEEHDRRMGLME